MKKNSSNDRLTIAVKKYITDRGKFINTDDNDLTSVELGGKIFCGTAISEVK
jgi:hypothetical protein